MKLIRFGVSIEEDLLERFDQFIEDNNYQNRSKVIRDLIRNSLVQEEWASEQIIAGGISIVYDHHKRNLVNTLMDVQHDFHDIIISSQHVHLDHDNCLEIIVIKGLTKKVKQLYNLLKSVKGIKHISIFKSTTGRLSG